MRFAVFRSFRVISVRLAVLCYSLRCSYVFLCGFAVFVPPLRPARDRQLISPQYAWTVTNKGDKEKEKNIVIRRKASVPFLKEFTKNKSDWAAL